MNDSITYLKMAPLKRTLAFAAAGIVCLALNVVAGAPSPTHEDHDHDSLYPTEYPTEAPTSAPVVHPTHHNNDHHDHHDDHDHGYDPHYDGHHYDHDYAHYVDICPHRANIIFLMDLSSSVQGKLGWGRIKRQAWYTQKVMDEASYYAGEKVHFQITGYSRYAAHVRSLMNEQCYDPDYMGRKLKTFKDFKFKNWDSPKNGFRLLTKPGAGYTHIDLALKKGVRSTLDKAAEYYYGEHNFKNTTVILFSDGRPEHFKFRKAGPKTEFAKSMERAKLQRRLLLEEYGYYGVHIHCVMIKEPKNYIDEFTHALCDSWESLYADKKRDLKTKLRFHECPHGNPYHYDDSDDDYHYGQHHDHHDEHDYEEHDDHH